MEDGQQIKHVEHVKAEHVKIEEIGNVTLDYTYYQGSDLYSDGDIEDEMLEIVKNNPPGRFPEIIEKRRSWPVFYHLSPFRSNIIDWLPFRKTDKVLEIGSGCGAITGALAKHAGSVTCVDLSRKRSLVNAWRNRQCGNITIMVGNFKDIEPHLDTDYDYVLLIGVFEYGQAYIGGAAPYEDFMRLCNRHRKLDGRMIIAIENKFGLKYWAGCREDHLGTYFSGLEGYHEGGPARTFTRHGLERILEKAGIQEYFFYYPYPDYKFMTCVYSDRYLPQKGELSNNLRNFDRERIILFDEKQVFDQIIEEGEFPLFSNSYLLVAGAAPNVVYAKFSNDRAPEWAIRTAVVRPAPGHVYVEKRPDTEEACGHLQNTMRAYELLVERYQGTKINISQCTVLNGDIRNGLAFEYCEGETLESLLDACLAKADVPGFKALVDEYMYWLSYREEEYQVSNLDFIFPNILVDGENWYVIDYEWTYDSHTDAKTIAFRAFYNYMLGGETREACKELLMKDILGLSDLQIATAVQKERSFQNRITGNRASVDCMRELIGNRAYELDGMLSYCNYADQKFVVQIFFDYGKGFSEEDSVRLRDCYQEGKRLQFQYDLPEKTERVRIDPCAYRCVVNIGYIKVGDRPYTMEIIETNGVWQECGAIVFDSDDPNVIFTAKGGRRLSVQMEVLELPEGLAGQLVKTAEKNDFMSKAKGYIKSKLKRGI